MASWNGEAQRQVNPVPVVLLILTLGAMAYAGWTFFRPAIQAQPSDHAEVTHGADAYRARDCLDRKGVFQQWQEPNKGPIHQLCQDDDGTIYDQIVKKDARTGEWVEKSAFVPKEEHGNLLRDIIRWLQNKGASRIQGVQ